MLKLETISARLAVGVLPSMRMTEYCFAEHNDDIISKAAVDWEATTT